MKKNNYDSPIFLCGYPKSGTTLLVSLLDGHKDLLVIPEESNFFKKVLPRSDSERFNTLFRDTNISAIQRGLVDEPSGLRDYRDVDFDLLRSSANEYWKESSKSPKHLLESLVYGLSRSTGKDHFLHLVEKTPRNELYLEHITSWWPEAIAVFMIRDPRQTFCSHREYQKKKLKPSKIVINRFVINWAESVRAFLKYLANGGTGLIIRYEDLTCEPTRVMNELAHFLNISFDKNLLVPTRNNVNWVGNSSIEGGFNGIKKQRMNYRQKLSQDEIEKIEISLGKFMEEFGYSCDNRYTRMKVLFNNARLFINTRGKSFAGRGYLG